MEIEELFVKDVCKGIVMSDARKAAVNLDSKACDGIFKCPFCGKEFQDVSQEKKKHRCSLVSFIGERILIRTPKQPFALELMLSLTPIIEVDVCDVSPLGFIKVKIPGGMHFYWLEDKFFQVVEILGDSEKLKVEDNIKA